MTDKPIAMKSLLVVDDEPQVLTALKDQLEDEYLVFVLESAAAALEFLKTDRNVSVIISDQRMPGMAGDEFLTKARRLSGATRVLITGYADLKAVVRAVNDGQIFGYISKPWDAAQLKVTIHKAVEYYEVSRDLIQERALLNNLMDSLPDQIFFKDTEHRYLRVNRAKAAALGLDDPERAIGQSSTIFATAERKKEIESEEDEILRNGTPVIDKVIKFTAADGTERWVSNTKAPIYDDRGKAVSIVGVSRDITNRKIADQQFQQAQKMEAVGQLTGGIAHDFNNLLTVILGNAELLIERPDDNKKYRSMAKMMFVAAQRGADLTQRLLAFSRRQALEPRIVDINRLLADMEPLLQRTLAENISIRLACADGLWMALVDPGQLENAILNLCINARDAMPAGGTLTIETQNAHLDEDYARHHVEVVAGDYVMVAVTDTGTGISSDIVAKIFDPFFTTKGQGKGTGLGLSMVYGFIKQSGGHVKAYSEVGHGTTMKLYLPRTIEQNGETYEVPESVAADGGSETILMVEDDDLVRTHVERQLKTLGYRVMTASTGPEALALFRKNPDIDLLFTDVIMPGGMNGKELADAARKIKPDLNVLFTSGYTENAIVHQGRLDPGACLLSKPYRLADLAQTIRSALSQNLD